MHRILLHCTINIGLYTKYRGIPKDIVNTLAYNNTSVKMTPNNMFKIRNI